MLKIITTVQEESENVRLYLYGQFTDEYVPVVEKALSGQGANSHRVTLDLANVTFVDRAGMMFLSGASSRNVAVENIPSYVTRWIEQEGRRSPALAEPF